MFVANNNINNTKIIDETKNIEINDYIKIKVVDNFKLLGVTIDYKFNFSKFINETCLKINKKLYSIKKIFYLSTSVKLQFF